MKELTLVLIKPDGLKKSLTGNVLTRLSETKLDIVAARIVKVSKELAEEHYQLRFHLSLGICFGETAEVRRESTYADYPGYRR